MKFEERHLSDEELIEILYLDCLPHSHVSACSRCRVRMFKLQQQREIRESEQLPTADLQANRLAVQRRIIYDKLAQASEQQRGFTLPNLKLVSAAAAALMLASGLFVYHQDVSFHQQHVTVQQEDTISDAELAREVSLLSQNAEAAPVEPLQALFE